MWRVVNFIQSIVETKGGDSGDLALMGIGRVAEKFRRRILSRSAASLTGRLYPESVEGFREQTCSAASPPS